jgi:hypothetical protein
VRRIGAAVDPRRTARLDLLRRVRTATQSTNPAIRLEGQVAQQFRQALVGFQKQVFSGGRRVGEIDVELTHAIIEVTTGVGKGKVGQVQRLLANQALNPQYKPVILFGPHPNLQPGIVAAIERAGGRVARSREELASLVGGE